MNNIVQFIPQRDAEAATNVAMFIDLCRNQLKIFGDKLDFDSNAWDVTDYIEKKGMGRTRFRLVFSNYDSSKRRSAQPMSEPFLSFAKSYIRYKHGIRPCKSVQHTISSLRALERALYERDGSALIEKADAEIFTNAANLVISKFESKSAYIVGTFLEKIADFCTDNYLTIVPIRWRSHIKRSQDRNRIGIEADRLRMERLPSDAAFDALPRAFHLASSAPDIIVTSVAAILCGSPGRISEVLTLPVDCEVVQKLDNGKTAYGLRWWPSKGAEPMVKWIIPSMVDVVKEAIKRVREVTNEARQIAKWYEEHPQQIYLPKEFEHLRKRQTVHLDDVVIIFGKYDRTYAKKWLLNKGIITKNLHCSFEDLQQLVLGLLPTKFPFLAHESNLKYSQALFVLQHNIFNSKSPNRCMFETVTKNIINYGLGGKIQHGISSIFSRFGFTEPDGSPIKVTTHQFRHYLNTLAQRGGLSQLDIAKWSGRKDIRQNEVYDHMSGDELIAKLREVAGDDLNTFGLPAKLPERTPISYEQFLSLQIPAAHVTELGYCIHDWTLLPCQLHRDCIHCSEHCFIKGDTTRTERIKQCLNMALQQLSLAEDAMKQKFAGADRWTEHQRATVERFKNLCEILENPNVPNGALIRLATAEEPSQIRIAIDTRKQLEDKKKKTLPKGK